MSNEENSVTVDKSESDAIVDASNVHTEDQVVTDLDKVADPSSNKSSAAVEVEADLVVKKVEVLGAAQPTVAVAATEDASSAAAPQEDRTEDQVTELEEDKLLVKMSGMSGKSLDDVANLPDDSSQAADAEAGKEQPNTGAMQQLEITVEDKALVSVGVESVPVDSVSEVKSETDEAKSKQAAESGEAPALPEKTSADVSEADATKTEASLSEDPASKKSSAVSKKSTDEKSNKMIQLTPQVEEVSVSEATEDKSSKKASTASSKAETDKKTSTASKAAEEDKSSPKTSKADDAKKKASTDKAPKEDEAKPPKADDKAAPKADEAKPAETKADKDAAAKKASTGSKSEEPPADAKKSSTDKSAAEDATKAAANTENKMIELTPAVADEPLITVVETSKSEAAPEPGKPPADPKGVVVEPAAPADKAPESPKEDTKKKDRSAKLDKEPDKASKFGGRAKKATSAKDEPKADEAAKKTSAAKDPAGKVVEPAAEETPAAPATAEAAAGEAKPEEPKAEEPPAGTVVEPGAEPAAAEPAAPTDEAAAPAGEPAAAAAGEEAPKEDQAAAPPAEDQPKADEGAPEKAPGRKASQRIRFSPTVGEDSGEKPAPRRDDESRPSAPAAAAYSSSSSYTPSSGGGRFTSSYSPSSKPADYLPFYRHTPSYVSTFDNLVNVGSFSQNLYGLERSRSRSRIRSQSKSRYQALTRDYSLPASLQRSTSSGYVSGAVSRSSSSSTLQGYVDHKNYELRRDYSRSRFTDSYPLSRSNTSMFGTSPAQSINRWYGAQQSSVDHYVNKINEPLSSVHRNYASYYTPSYSNYATTSSYDRPSHGGYSAYGYGVSRSTYPAYDSRFYGGTVRTGRFDLQDNKYLSGYQPSLFRGFALTSGPIMGRSGYW